MDVSQNKKSWVSKLLFLSTFRILWKLSPHSNPKTLLEAEMEKQTGEESVFHFSLGISVPFHLPLSFFSSSSNIFSSQNFFNFP